jgi:ribosomal protein S18 acetylase RimI-like enzyme
MLAEAFTVDPLIDFLFDRSPTNLRNRDVQEFFETLLAVRVTLGMPCWAAVAGEEYAGAVMGYDVSRPKWPAASQARWQQLLTQIAGLSDRLASYETSAGRFEPAEPHFYLGVIGVNSKFRGAGVGKSLLAHFARLSNQSVDSHGVFLETASSQSLAFYLQNQYQLCGTAKLGSIELWCVFQPAVRTAV